jgi:TRAP-type C4-dicarboxylate transport system permease large subunit
MVNLVVSLSIRRCANKFMNVMMWEHCTSASQFLDVAKFSTLTQLPLLISFKLSLPVLGLKMSSLPTLALKSPILLDIINQQYVGYMESR